MIDDDLDKLLSDVDGPSENSIRGDGPARVKYRPSTNTFVTGGKNGEGPFSETSLIDRLKNKVIDNSILIFKDGVLPAINQHYLNTDNFRKLLIEHGDHESIQDLIQKYKYTFMRFIENIQRFYEEASLSLSMNSLVKKAKKDYSLRFEGFEEENQLDFIVLIELFLLLREFNSKIRWEWSELSRSIGVINLTTEGKNLFSELNALIESSLSLCASTDGFLLHVADFLSIPREDRDVLERDIHNRATYSQSIQYSYAALFNSGDHQAEGHVRQVQNDKILEHDSAKIKKDRMVAPVEKLEVPEDSKNVNSVPSDQKMSSDSSEEADVGFRLRGTQSWNTREPYTIKLSRAKLDKDYDDISASFYFMSGSETPEMEQAIIKRAMVRFLSDTTKNIQADYEAHLFKTLIAQTQELCDYFELKGEMRNIFLYHCGPATFYRVLISIFQTEKTGLCFKYLPGNKVVRYLPMEFIKEKVLQWYEANINILNLDFDKIQFFDEVRRTVLLKYNTELAANSHKLDEIVEKMQLDDNPKFNKQEFFKSKWGQWFGISRIQVYNRFIEKSTFR